MIGGIGAASFVLRIHAYPSSIRFRSNSYSWICNSCSLKEQATIKLVSNSIFSFLKPRIPNMCICMEYSTVGIASKSNRGMICINTQCSPAQKKLRLFRRSLKFYCTIQMSVFSNSHPFESISAHSQIARSFQKQILKW